MTRRGRGAWTAAALVLAGCRPAVVPDPTQQRLERLEAGFTVLARDAAGAARQLAGAGPGAALERARVEAWLAALERSRAPSGEWSRLRELPPPSDLVPRVLVGHARALLAEGHVERAVADLEQAAAAGAPAAWEELLGLRGSAEQAAARLAIVDPGLLRRLAPELEPAARARLDPAARRARIDALQRQGRLAEAAEELATLAPGSPDLRVLRARVLAEREEWEAALALLEGADGPGAHLARAQILRNRAWQVHPAATAAGWWRRALVAARIAVRAPEVRREALPLLLESATEAGAPGEAWAAWRALEETGWDDERRSWLGRRLGVALAHGGRADDAVRTLAGALPAHERCLLYWRARAAGDEAVLEHLAAAPVGDLYAVWARRRVGRREPSHLPAEPAVGLGNPPPSVRRLLEWGATEAAAAEWERLRARRGATPHEALGAAALSAGLGRSIEAIQWLLAGYPALGTVGMDRVPRDVVQAYLPLLFAGDLERAAREAGVAPWLVAALARQESTFQPGARSAAGARGILQLVPSTAALHAEALGLGTDPDLLDPGVNLRLGAHELARLIRLFGALEPALAAYNAGETRVMGWWRRTPDAELFAEEIAIPETYNYVRRVVYLAEAYRLLHEDVWEEPP